MNWRSINQADLFDQISKPSYWTSLCSELTLTEDLGLLECTDVEQDLPIRETEWDVCKTLVHQDGYFAYDRWFDDAFVEKLADCVLKLQAHNIPPIFCFVFDEFWQLMLRLDPLLSDLLGEYELVPAIWAWHVRPDNQTAFPPHRDQVRDIDVEDEEHLDYLTVWIPLTNLNHLSSCIALLPASRDPNYDAGIAETPIENLQDIRMLQGGRGSVFCWTTGLVHWGTRQSYLGEPRISVGLYVKNPAAEDLDNPPLDFEEPLSLSTRLSVIGQQIIDYSRTADEKLLNLAQQLAVPSERL